jgi:Zn-dependent peptidase ImmA (M78 family)
MVAQKLLQQYSVRIPPVDVSLIANRSGLSVSEIELDDDVWAVLDPDRKEIFIRAQDHDNRKRFSLAHELGHFFLGHCNGLHIEKAYRNSKSIEGLYTVEIEANQFAADLLMPAVFIADKMKAIVDKTKVNIDELVKSFATDFNVSSQAMEIRLKNLGYISLTDEDTDDSI